MKTTNAARLLMLLSDVNHCAPVALYYEPDADPEERFQIEAGESEYAGATSCKAFAAALKGEIEAIDADGDDNFTDEQNARRDKDAANLRAALAELEAQ